MSRGMTVSAMETSPLFGDGGVQKWFSPELGPERHLPRHVIWGIIFATASGMAMINFAEVFLIEFCVSAKFWLMQSLASFHWTLGMIVLVLVTVFFSAVGVMLIVFVDPSCAGSGLPENKCFLNGSSMSGLYTPRSLGIRVATSILANAAGFPVGREGPSVSIGSNLAYVLTAFVAGGRVREKVKGSDKDGSPAIVANMDRLDCARRVACACGGACGIAMIFNAPMGGLLYMFEEMTPLCWPLDLTFFVFFATMACALMSYCFLSCVHKEIFEFVIYEKYPHHEHWGRGDIALFIVMAAVLGLLAAIHTRLMLSIAKSRKQFTPWLQQRLQRFGHPLSSLPAVVWETLFYGAVCALASIVAALTVDCMPRAPHEGLKYVRFNCKENEYNPVASLLLTTSHSAVKLLFCGSNMGDLPAAADLIAFITYFMMNVGLSGLPVPGGAFTATMLLGGLFGRFVANMGLSVGLDITQDRGIYAVVGSAAMLCGFKQMTLTVVVIIVECVEDISLSPLVMLGVAVAITVMRACNPRGHDEEQIHSKKLPFLEGHAPKCLAAVTAVDLCDPGVASHLPRQASVSEVQRALEEKATQSFPVLDEEGVTCLGVVVRAHLEQAMERSAAVGRPDAPMKDDAMVDLDGFMDPAPVFVPENMPARRLYPLFAKAGERYLCVVSKTGAFRGVISRDGLINACRQGPLGSPVISALVKDGTPL